MRQRRFRHVEVAIDVCLERPVPLFFRYVLETFLVLLKCSVVNQDVELAKLVDCLLHKLFANLRIANIARKRKRFLALGFDRALRFLSVTFFLFQESERDVGAFARKEHCDRTTDTGITTSDQRHLLFQLSSALIHRRFVTWLRIDLRLNTRLRLVLRRHRRLWLLELAVSRTAFLFTATTLRRFGLRCASTCH